MFVDPFGLNIVNAHDQELDDATDAYNSAVEARDNYSGDKKGKIRKLDRAVNKAKDKMDYTQAKFNAVNEAMQNLATNNPEEYSALDNLKDEGGITNVDVYVAVVDDLHSNDIPGTDASKKNVKLDGGTDANADVFDNVQYSTGKHYKGTTSTQFGVNTAAIYIENLLSNKSKGSVLAHEGGHVIYQVGNMKAYSEFKNTKDFETGGHGRNDKSGIEAIKQQKIYDENSKH